MKYVKDLTYLVTVYDRRRGSGAVTTQRYWQVMTSLAAVETRMTWIGYSCRGVAAAWQLLQFVIHALID